YEAIRCHTPYRLVYHSAATTTEFYALSLHDALPISAWLRLLRKVTVSRALFWNISLRQYQRSSSGATVGGKSVGVSRQPPRSIARTSRPSSVSSWARIAAVQPKPTRTTSTWGSFRAILYLRLACDMWVRRGSRRDDLSVPPVQG